MEKKEEEIQLNNLDEQRQKFLACLHRQVEERIRALEVASKVTPELLKEKITI